MIKKRGNDSCEEEKQETSHSNTTATATVCCSTNNKKKTINTNHLLRSTENCMQMQYEKKVLRKLEK